MIEIAPPRKNKICLTDYDFQRDLNNRILMASFSPSEIEVLEELLFSPLKFPIKRLQKNLSLSEEEIQECLKKIIDTSLFKIDNDTIEIDKDIRRYFEAQILKFEEDFTPGVDFLQELLKGVPIHVLPVWYAIPRTSNNIFESLVEKLFETPQIFQRYLKEIDLGDPVLNQITQDVYNAPDLCLPANIIIEKYKLTREQFEEIMISLEFNLTCFTKYENCDGEWQQVITVLEEWRDYLRFLKKTEPTSIANQEDVTAYRPGDYAFISDFSAFLTELAYSPLLLTDECTFHPEAIRTVCEKLELNPNNPWSTDYLDYLLSKSMMLKFADCVEGRLYLLDNAREWLDMSISNRAMFLYRHQFKYFIIPEEFVSLFTERNIREVEKSIVRILDKGWVYLDDFLQSLIVSCSENSTMVLKRTGRLWQYTKPDYTETERNFIKKVVMHWLFEAGMIATGSHDGKECLSVTPLGQELFGS